MSVLVVDSGRWHGNEKFQHTFRSYETRAFLNFGLFRDYLVDVLFYASFRGLHNALCHSLYSRVSGIHHKEWSRTHRMYFFDSSSLLWRDISTRWSRV